MDMILGKYKLKNSLSYFLKLMLLVPIAYNMSFQCVFHHKLFSTNSQLLLLFQ